MNLAQMQALANRTGLVPMKLRRAFAPWRVGEVAGFPPETALDHYQNGVAALLGDEPGEFNPVDPLDHDGRKGGSKPKEEVVQVPTLEELDAMHPLKRVKVAEDLGWKKPPKEEIPEGTKVSDLAHDFLAALIAEKEEQKEEA